jgi:serine/threonine protein kinase
VDPRKSSTPPLSESLGTLGRYQLLQRIATGGMGELFLARARSIGGFEKLAAIKRILPHLAAQPEFVEMFLDEARMAATLEHPNIIHVSDLGHVGNDYFLVMPFLEGADLSVLRKTLLKQGRVLPLSLALFIAIGVASGLDYAHTRRDREGRAAGLIHRDVSPENVFVTFEGEVKLLDFGIAKVAASATRTAVGTRKGKAQYMSPEQARGAELDARSDVFSLGVVLYELTTGRPLFRADNELSVLNLIVSRDATPPSQVSPDYPPALENIVLRALARDPQRRYQSAGQLRDALSGFARKHGHEASAVELGAFLIGALGANATPAAHDPNTADRPSLPPPPVSGALLVEPDRARARGTGTPTVIEPRPDAEVVLRTPGAITREHTGNPDPATSRRTRWMWAGAGMASAGALFMLGWSLATPSRVASPTSTTTPAVTEASVEPPMKADGTGPSVEQVVGMVNEPSWDKALDYADRHEALRYLQAIGASGRVDEPLQVSLDLVQAAAAAKPCEVFDAALSTIERVPSPYFAAALASAKVPVEASKAATGDRTCDDLPARLSAAIARSEPRPR